LFGFNKKHDAIVRGKGIRSDVFEWLDNVLGQEVSDDVIAFCFNLYDDGDCNWSMEVVGTERFDVEDSDWPCDEITHFGTRENPFAWNSSIGWEKVLKDMMSILLEYISNGKYANVLKSGSGVGVGFVDGDVEIIYTK